jgi:FAD/FMN-containing dehydrogenase/Fe-S oxidoreductase
LIEGELAFASTARCAYRGDAGPFEYDPLGVIAPRHERDLAVLLQYAADRGLSIHPRGAGTGEGGCSSGPGLVVDMSRHFRRLKIDGDTVLAGAGVVLDLVNHRLESIGRQLAVDPLGTDSATVAGAIGVNAYGPRSHAYGSMADQVESLRCLLGSGEPVTLRNAVRAPDAELVVPPTTLEQLGHRLQSLIARNTERVTKPGHPSWGGQAGYQLQALAGRAGIDLAKLGGAGAGSLVVITEARLRTVPTPAACSVVVASFGRLADGAEAVAVSLSSRPLCCELYDGRSISLARESDPLVREAVPEPPEAVLIVGFEGADSQRVADQTRRLSDRLIRSARLAHDPSEFHQRSEALRFIGLRRLIDGRLNRGHGPRRPLALWDEIVVPVDSLASLVVRLQALLKRLGIAAVIDAHAGLGRVRVRPLLDLGDDNDRAHVTLLGDAVRELVIQLGGTAGAGHGTGRSAWMRRFQGTLVNLHREIKYAFDPLGLLNPNAIAVSDGPGVACDLRPAPARGTVDRLVQTPQTDTMILSWPDRSRAEHLSACVNCGVCRSQEPTLRMCPVFRASLDEAAAPRAKVNLLRQVAAGTVDPRKWGSDEFRNNAELCVHCKLCESECPAGVDVSSLMLEAKAAFVANHGLRPEDWMLSRIDSWSEWASRAPRLFNLLMASRGSRWLLERAFGLSRQRVLPAAARQSFLKRAEHLGLTRPKPSEPGPRAVYFLDIFANHFDCELAESTVAVLRHLGVNVFVPKGQRGCGMPALVTGDIDRARDLVVANLRILGNAVRDGYTVICTEPTALLMLKQEALRVTEDLDAQLVASNARDAGQYVLGLLRRGDVPLPSTPVNARGGYHQPCHQRALDIGNPGLELMRLIPGLETTFIDQGCSGMAGIYGFSRRQFRASLRAGRPLRRRLRNPEIEFGATECSACRMQMEQGTTLRTVHPMKLLALSYGLDPTLSRHVSKPKPRRRLAE